MLRRPTYPSDLTDDQWALIEPLLPPANTGGRPEKHPRRDVVGAILYVVRTGYTCPWISRPGRGVYWYFSRWEEAKVTEQIMAVLRRRIRRAEGHNGEPSVGIIDPQSAKGADTAGQGTRGSPGSWWRGCESSCPRRCTSCARLLVRWGSR